MRVRTIAALVVVLLFAAAVGYCEDSKKLYAPSADAEVWNLKNDLREFIIPPVGTPKDEVDQIFGKPQDVAFPGFGNPSDYPQQDYCLLQPEEKQDFRASLYVTYRRNRVYRARINHSCDDDRFASPRRNVTRERLTEVSQGNRLILRDLLETYITHCLTLPAASWNKAKPGTESSAEVSLKAQLIELRASLQREITPPVGTPGPSLDYSGKLKFLEAEAALKELEPRKYPEQTYRLHEKLRDKEVSQYIGVTYGNDGKVLKAAVFDDRAGLCMPSSSTLGAAQQALELLYINEKYLPMLKYGWRNAPIAADTTIAQLEDSPRETLDSDISKALEALYEEIVPPLGTPKESVDRTFGEPEVVKEVRYYTGPVHAYRLLEPIGKADFRAVLLIHYKENRVKEIGISHYGDIGGRPGPFSPGERLKYRAWDIAYSRRHLTDMLEVYDKFRYKLATAQWERTQPDYWRRRAEALNKREGELDSKVVSLCGSLEAAIVPPDRAARKNVELVYGKPEHEEKGERCRYKLMDAPRLKSGQISMSIGYYFSRVDSVHISDSSSESRTAFISLRDGPIGIANRSKLLDLLGIFNQWSDRLSSASWISGDLGTAEQRRTGPHKVRNLPIDPQVAGLIEAFRACVVPPKDTAKADVETAFGAPDARKVEAGGTSDSAVFSYELLKFTALHPSQVTLFVTYRDGKAWDIRVEHLRPAGGQSGPTALQDRYALADLLDIYSKFRDKLIDAPWNVAQD